MKKTILYIALAFSCYVSAQVGIGTLEPKATLDISKNVVNTSIAKDGILIPKISKAKLADKIIGTYDVDQISTLVYVDNITNLPLTNLSANQVTNINAIGWISP